MDAHDQCGRWARRSEAALAAPSSATTHRPCRTSPAAAGAARLHRTSLEVCLAETSATRCYEPACIYSYGYHIVMAYIVMTSIVMAYMVMVVVNPPACQPGLKHVTEMNVLKAQRNDAIIQVAEAEVGRQRSWRWSWRRSWERSRTGRDGTVGPSLDSCGRLSHLANSHESGVAPVKVGEVCERGSVFARNMERARNLCVLASARRRY